MNLTPLFFKDIPKFDNTTVLDHLYSLCYDSSTDKISLRKYGFSSNSPIVSHNSGNVSFSFLDGFDIYDVLISSTIDIVETTDDSSYNELRFFLRNTTDSIIPVYFLLFDVSQIEILLPKRGFVEVSVQSFDKTRTLLFKTYEE